jgi:hypothetical protein
VGQAQATVQAQVAKVTIKAWFANPYFQPPVFGGFLLPKHCREDGSHGLVYEPMLNILLLGVVHEFQRQEPRFLYVPKEKVQIYLAQVRLYAHWVRTQIDGFEAELIFDEMNLPEWEHFNRLEDFLVVPWMYMDIPENVRKRFNLTAARPPGKEVIPEIDEPRERHWLKTIESVSTECKLHNVVVLVGAAHLPTFSQKLIEAGHDVKSMDVRKTEWYNAGYSNSSSPEGVL